MPRFAEHAVIGIGTGALFGLVVQASRRTTTPTVIDPVHLSICGLAGFLGGCVPDKLEPANRAVGPNHRGVFHSVWFLALMLKGAHHCAMIEPDGELERWCVDVTGAFCAGVSSHLIADSSTKRGLNFVCKKF